MFCLRALLGHPVEAVLHTDGPVLGLWPGAAAMGADMPGPGIRHGPFGPSIRCRLAALAWALARALTAGIGQQGRVHRLACGLDGGASEPLGGLRAPMPLVQVPLAIEAHQLQPCRLLVPDHRRKPEVPHMDPAAAAADLALPLRPVGHLPAAHGPRHPVQRQAGGLMRAVPNGFRNRGRLWKTGGFPRHNGGWGRW